MANGVQDIKLNSKSLPVGHDQSSNTYANIVKIKKLETVSHKLLYSFIKRALDITVSFLALVFLAIPMLFVAALIKIDSPGPVFYRQERLGLKGRPFTIIKFRSMCINAEANGAQWAEKNDLRVTKIGRTLRATRFDEVPQFFLVIKGDLSLIGPRPEREVFYDEFEKYIPGFRQRMLVKPGVSGLAQVKGGYDFRPEEKIFYDIEYIKNRSFWLDLKIIFMTLGVVFSHRGAR